MGFGSPYPYEIQCVTQDTVETSINKQSDVIDGIMRAQSIEHALENLMMVENAKHALEFADSFKRESVRYAMLESAALVRVVQLGGAKKIKPRRRRLAAEWLASMNESERVQYIELCNDGLTLEHIWQRIIGDPKQQENAEIKAKAYADSILDTYDSMGVVCLQQFEDKLDSMKLPEDVAQGFKDRVRDKLRRKQALGIGDGLGTYINPKVSDQLSKAISVRVASIEADIINLVDIVKHSQSDKKPIVHIDTVHNQTWDIPINDAIMLLLAYCGVVQVEANNIKKAGKIIHGLINTLCPELFASTYLLESVIKALRLNGNQFTDKYGSLECYLKNWLEEVTDAQKTRVW